MLIILQTYAIYVMLEIALFMKFMKFGYVPIITTKTERILYDETDEIRNTKRAEAVTRKKVCDYCGKTFGKKFNSNKHVQNVHNGDITFSVLSKSIALDSENTDKDILEELFVFDDGTILDLNMYVIDRLTPIYQIIKLNENNFQNNPFNSTTKQLNIRNTTSIDLSKIKYNQDPGPSNA